MFNTQSMPLGLTVFFEFFAFIPLHEFNNRRVTFGPMKQDGHQGTKYELDPLLCERVFFVFFAKFLMLLSINQISTNTTHSITYSHVQMTT